jgi:hypothetical protein
LYFLANLDGVDRCDIIDPFIGNNFVESRIAGTFNEQKDEQYIGHYGVKRNGIPFSTMNPADDPFAKPSDCAHNDNRFTKDKPEQS